MSHTREPELVWRLRLLAGALALSALCFTQSPGLIVPDTKLDLTEDPGGFLARALSLWDPSAAFGQLQNQAYGYLFPVGPFHLGLIELGVPAWVVQRLWWSVILVTAFVGMWRLTRSMAVGSPWSRYAAALLFAVSPRFMSEVSVTSVEVWPLALAPWVLEPLVDPAPRSWASRVGRSALAVAFVGGVNAVATGAVLVLPFLWLVTRRPVRHHLLMTLVWLTAVLAGILWWLGPLMVLGRYSPPFLDWIENAAVTTAFASPFEALRGTTPWLNYLVDAGTPSWPAGWLLVTQPTLILAAVIAAALGLAGLVGAPDRIRSFLGLGLLVGLALVTLGFTGAGGSLAGPWVQELLDGPGAPLRNTHKFELVIRVVLTVGVAQALWQAQRFASRANALPFVVPAVVAGMVLTLAAPALAAALPRNEGYAAIPTYWRDAAEYLDAQDGEGAVLVTPGAAFADFVWGSTKDEPFQALLDRPFVTRDAVPLGSAGATRFLDAVESRLRHGHGGEGLRTALAHAGIRFIVVRHDLRPDVVANVTLRVHEALQSSGLTVNATFGPPMSPPGETLERAVDYRTRLPFPAITVYEVPEASEVLLMAVDDVISAQSAASEDTVDMGSVWTGPMTLLGSDAVRHRDRLGTGRTVLVDGNQRREVFFGRSQDPYSQVLSATDPLRTGRDVATYVSDHEAPTTDRVWTDELENILTSSSASDANATVRLGPAAGPGAAVDGDPATSWVSGRFGSGVGEWLELRFTRPVDLTGMSIVAGHPPFGSAATQVLVESDHGSMENTIAPGGERRLRAPAGWASWVRITAQRFSTADRSVFTVAEVKIPSVTLGTALQVAVPASSDDAVLIRKTTQGTTDCAFVNGRSFCAPLLDQPAESENGIRRVVVGDYPETRAMRGSVVPRPGKKLEALLEGLTTVAGSASSRMIESPAGRPAAVVDGRLDTTWVASETDSRPWIELDFPSPVATDGAQLLVDAYVAAARARTVLVSFDGGPPVNRGVSRDGWVWWPTTSFSRLRVTIIETYDAVNVDGVTGFETPLPVGISEVELRGVTLPAPSLQSTSVTGMPCGFGPELHVGERRVPTRVTGTVDDVMRGRPLTWQACEALPSFTGTTVIHAASSAEFSPTTLSLGRLAEVPPDGATSVTHGASVSFAAIQPETDSRIVALPQNFSMGWVAYDDVGDVLEPVRVDGWKQGWILPRGRVVTNAQFAPNTAYTVMLIAGALTLLGLTATSVAVARRRRPNHCVPQVMDHGQSLGRGAVLVCLAVIGGVPGVVGAALGVGLSARATGSNRPGANVIVPPVLLGLAGLWVAADHWPDGSAGFENTPVAVLAYAAVAAAVVRR